MVTVSHHAFYSFLELLWAKSAKTFLVLSIIYLNRYDIDRSKERFHLNHFRPEISIFLSINKSTCDALVKIQKLQIAIKKKLTNPVWFLPT
jgi:hypothetical protein